MNTPTITPADIAKLTPGQKRQAQMIAEYSKATAARYIALVTKGLPAHTSQASCPKLVSIFEYQIPTKYKSSRLRDEFVYRISDPIKFLNLIRKPLIPHQWNGREFFTTREVAEYYGIPEKFVHNHLIAIRSELEADGFEGLRGKAANQAKQVICEGVTASRLLIWSPRAVIRLGLVMPESNIAAYLRQAIGGAA